MQRISGEKRTMIAVWAAVVTLVLALGFASFNAYGVEDKATSSSATSTASESSSTTAAESSATAASESASAAESGATSTVAGTNPEPTTFAQDVAAQVDEALARDAVPSNRFLKPVEGVSPDSGGSVFTFVSPLVTTEIAGDLYWLSNNIELSDSKIGNDVMAGAFQMDFKDADIAGDVRVAGQSVHLVDTVIGGNVDVGALEVTIDGQSAANGYYVGGGTVNFEGAARRFIAYGQSIYFDGVVDGDVTLSAQDIVIGPHAKITGLLDIRSGQNLGTLNIPAGAQIARIDTNLDHPNTIDQITQIRAAIAPYFQVGSMLFIVVSFILLGLAALWGFGHKLTEANRLVRRYPLAVLVLGCIALMLMFVIIMLGTVLIFTIPLSIIVALLLIVSIIFCIPFTGSSLALMLRDRIRPALCVVIGSAIGAILIFVPYVNQLVLLVSLIYFVGYMVNIAMFGHDPIHDASFHERQADEDAPHGKASGILPVAAVVANAMQEMGEDDLDPTKPAIGFDEEDVADHLAAEADSDGQAPVDDEAADAVDDGVAADAADDEEAVITDSAVADPADGE